MYTEIKSNVQEKEENVKRILHTLILRTQKCEDEKIKAETKKY